MEVRVWHSYSCNNSSSYRLVARFDAPVIASDAAAELTAFFAEQAKQMDALTEEDLLAGRPAEVAVSLATKYGFAWKDATLEADEAYVAAEKGRARGARRDRPVDSPLGVWRQKKFDAIHRASCTSCHGKLEYLEPRVHGIAKEHLSCGACGAMYELATFLYEPLGRMCRVRICTRPSSSRLCVRAS